MKLNRFFTLLLLLGTFTLLMEARARLSESVNRITHILSDDWEAFIFSNDAQNGFDTTVLQKADTSHTKTFAL